MKMKALIVVVIALAVGVGAFMAVRYTREVGEQLTAGGGTGKAKVTFFKEPVPLPELTWKTLDGRTLTNSDLKGKVVLVNFWATWCPPCRAEIPDLIKLQEQYKEHLVIIGVSSDEGPVDSVVKFSQQYRMNYPVVMETPEHTKAFPGIFALPTTFVVDQDLRIVQKHIGQIRPSQIELETRVLAKLSVDAEVERADDTAPAQLAPNARATDVPGLSLESLKPAQKTAALERLNDEQCTCGCGLTIAQCRINDPSCTVSLPIAEKIVQEIRDNP